MTGATQEISAPEAARLRDGTDALFLDVREAWEFDVCRIAGSLHIPMGEIPRRLTDIAKDRTIVVLCHHGMRSRQVMHFLAKSGYADVRNLAGGIDAWAREVEPGMATY